MSEQAYRLSQLISGVRESDPEGSHLDHLAEAVGVADHLNELADHLVGHFVDECRQNGSSWKEIGGCLGVSKQAAQKRFVPRRADRRQLAAGGLLGRFTDRARTVTARAQDEARSAHQREVTTEHVILGLLDQPDCLASRAIVGLGVSLAETRRRVERTMGPPDEEIPPGHLPFSRSAKKTLELALREALRAGDANIGTEHILLGVLRDGTTPGSRALIDLGVSRSAVEAWIFEAPDE